MSLQSRPPKLISVNKRMMEITPEELENATPNIEIHLGNSSNHLEITENGSALSEAPTLVASPSQLELSSSHEIPTIPKDIISVLYSFPVFQNMENNQTFFEEISKVVHMKKYVTGDVVIRQGTTAKAMFFVVKGLLKVISEDGEVDIGELSAGTYFGEVGILFDVQRTATVIAKTICILLTLNKEEVNQVLKSYPDIYKSMKQDAQSRISTLVKEYKKSGKKVTNEMKLISELEFEAEMITNSPTKLRTHTLDMQAAAEITQQDTQDSEEEEELDDLPEIKELPMNTLQPISAAAQLGRKLTEKRRASVAVWSDDKLMLFAQNVVNQTAAKESRLAKGFLASQQSLTLAENLETSLELQLKKVEKNGLFALSIDTIVHIMSFMNLKTLAKFRAANKLLNSACTDKEFQLLSTLDFTIYNKAVNDNTLAQFMSYAGPAVQNLILKNCWSITDGGIAQIMPLATKLVTLNLCSLWDLTDNGLIKIAEFSQLLESIDLANCRKITDHGVLAILEQAQNLKSINLSYCKNLTSKVLNNITWSNIQEVNLQRCTGIHDDGFKSWIMETSIPNSISLGFLTFALEDLNLSDCSFLTDATLQVLSKKCPQLRKLCLSFCCSLSDQFASSLTEGCPFIEILDISYCGGAATDMSMLTISQGLPRLEKLGLRGCVQLTDMGMEHLATHAISLKTINFTQCKNISPNICKKLGIFWKTTSQSVYLEGREATESRFNRPLSSIN